MTKQVIIVAGGSGSRMKAAYPKQFMLLRGKPVLMHTLEKFFQADPKAQIVVVLPQNEISSWELLCKEHDCRIPHKIVEGGKTRHASVKNGLAGAPGAEYTAVHDGVRPLVSPELINACFTAAEKAGNAVPCLPIQDSLRERVGDGNRFADRNAFVAIQTPQCFRTALLQSAIQSAGSDAFMDEASVVEAFGERIHLIDGERENLKITLPSDLLIAEVLLGRE